MFRLPPPPPTMSIGDQLVGALMQGMAAKQAAEERKIEKEQMRYRLKAMKMQEEQEKRSMADAEASKKRDEFKFVYNILSGQKAPVGDISNGISDIQGIPEADPMSALTGMGGAPINLEGGPGAPMSMPRTDMSGATPIGQNPEMQIPGTGIKVRPPTLDDAIRMKAQEDAREASQRLKNVFAETQAREIAQRQVAAQMPTPLTPTASERKFKPPAALAKLEGLSEYADKEMTVGEWDRLVSAKRSERSESRADARTERQISADKKKLQADQLRMVGSIDKEFKAAPGVKEALQSEQYFNNFDVAVKQYEKRLASGKPVGEAEEALVINRLRAFEPDSVVRETEFGRALVLSPVYERFKQLLPKLKRGGAVPPGFIQEAKETMNELRQFRTEYLKSKAAPYMARAEANGLPLNQFSFSVYVPGSGGSVEDILAKYDKK